MLRFISPIQTEFHDRPASGIAAALTVGARGWTKGKWAWMRLEDGRVSALHMPPSTHLTESDWAALATQLAVDIRGDLLELNLAEVSSPIALLHAAAVTPLHSDGSMSDLPVGPFGLQPVWPAHARRDIQRFTDGLDGEIQAFLRSLNAGRVYDSVRNYNRLAQLGPIERRNRMQAIRQYSPLLAHVFLTPHHHHDYAGGKLHRWRMHDEVIVNAVDTGKSLLPELARRFGTQKSVFKNALMQARWPSLKLARQEVLFVLDGMPAHRRPATMAELEHASPVFAWLKQQDLTADWILRRIGGEFFSAGIDPAMRRLRTRYPRHVLRDSHDFLNALNAFWERHAHQEAKILDNLTGRNCVSAWLCKYGLWSLLDASVRWHDWVRTEWPAVAKSWMPIVGDKAVEEWRCVELASAEDLAKEGYAMRHCVASHWEDCCFAGSRIFSLSRPDGEAATARYDLEKDGSDGWRYRLGELRGVANTDVTSECQRIALALERVLNAPELADRRLAVVRALSQQDAYQYEESPIDPESGVLAMSLCTNADVGRQRQGKPDPAQ